MFYVPFKALLVYIRTTNSEEMKRRLIVLSYIGYSDANQVRIFDAGLLNQTLTYGYSSPDV